MSVSDDSSEPRPSVLGAVVAQRRSQALASSDARRGKSARRNELDRPAQAHLDGRGGWGAAGWRPRRREARRTALASRTFRDRGRWTSGPASG